MRFFMYSTLMVAGCVFGMSEVYDTKCKISIAYDYHRDSKRDYLSRNLNLTTCLCRLWNCLSESWRVSLVFIVRSTCSFSWTPSHKSHILKKVYALVETPFNKKMFMLLSLSLGCEYSICYFCMRYLISAVIFY